MAGRRPWVGRGSWTSINYLLTFHLSFHVTVFVFHSCPLPQEVRNLLWSPQSATLLHTPLWGQAASSHHALLVPYPCSEEEKSPVYYTALSSLSAWGDLSLLWEKLFSHYFQGILLPQQNLFPSTSFTSVEKSPMGTGLYTQKPGNFSVLSVSGLATFLPWGGEPEPAACLSRWKEKAPCRYKEVKHLKRSLSLIKDKPQQPGSPSSWRKNISRTSVRIRALALAVPGIRLSLGLIVCFRETL